MNVLTQTNITKEEVEELFRNFAKEIDDLITPSLKKIEDIVSELKDINDDTDNHEKRVAKLEKKVFAT